ncbi:MAG: NAD(+)/NADH kinase [Pseudomonadales bacterium]
MSAAQLHRLGIVVNPMSGRDVRRVAARASTTTHHDKQQQVTRLVLAALEQGVDEIYLVKEPFRINERAVENLPQRDRITLLDLPLTHTSEDTVNITNAMWEHGCRTFVVLGGDGTNRIVSGTCPDANILPLSTGTNNVFPFMVEASVAGAAAGLIASGKLDPRQHCQRAKQVHVSALPQAHSSALVDAVLLKNDMLGSLLPFAAGNIASMVLAIAEPAAIGMSPIGGYLLPCRHSDDFGVLVVTGRPAVARLRVPISAGLYGDVCVREYRKLALGESVNLAGPGIMAFDGDRLFKVDESDQVTVIVQRDGPRIIEPATVMSAAVSAGCLLSPR